MFKPKKAPPAELQAKTMKTRSPLDLRIAELNEKRRAVVVEIVELEGRGFVNRPVTDAAGDAVERRARELLAEGGVMEGPAAISGSEGAARLRALFAERAAIDLALEIGGRMQRAESIDRQGQILASRMDEWREIIFQTCQTLATLQRLNRAREKFRHELWTSFGAPVLPGGDFKLFGTGATNAGEAYEFLQMAIRAGITTPKEIESWL